MTIDRRFSIFLGNLLLCSVCLAQIGIWTSAEELADKPMSGPPWEVMKASADEVDPAWAYVSNQDNNNNSHILAAAIVYARSGDETYKGKVVAACEQLANAGYPVLSPEINGNEADNRTLAWARETGSYALAADLVGYRTTAFGTWLRNMAEVYVGTDNRTLLYMFQLRPNNWGTHAFGSLCAIYAFLQDTTRLAEVRDYWVQAVLGPKPETMEYGEISWHVDSNNLRLINPKGAVKQGLNIDGVMPDDMRRNGSFSNPPPSRSTDYHWGFLQGTVIGARILERFGLSIWDVADSAIYRAGYAFQVRWEATYGGWKADGDDLWMLPFFDDTYGTSWTEGQPERVWEHGKNAGWPYVVWDGSPVSGNVRYDPLPGWYELEQNFPNPFNPTTLIRFSLPYTTEVHLAVYDLLGKEVATLYKGVRSAGEYTIKWGAETSGRRMLPSGLYLCRLQSGEYTKVIKMTMTR
ncbi:MAG: T9SS type A sorting domain-containing protein [Fidelibacterota bacterium]|nr:MAG: T9SS type A sorting domain-containing protein [Candidatus Neomarinimicrobiota bacterium]